MRTLADRGWLADGVLTASGNAAYTELEARTDAQEQSIVATLDWPGRGLRPDRALE